jgi:pimeloyl-ACP methyl ester carboxylesterase
VANFRAEQFAVSVSDEVLADLRARIRNTRWPGAAPGAPWEQGTDLGYLRDLLEYWADGFDWGAQERGLNGFRHFQAVIDGVRVHFVHERARSGHGIPLILTNGWPSCFAEFLPLVPWLTDPAAHGLDGPGFDVVIPSLPGYGFSERPARTGVTCRYTAGLWHQLMQGLGYQRYGAHGSDFGSAVTTFMALDNPAPMLGIHLSNLDLAPYTGPGSRPLSAAEGAYLAQYQRWRDDDRGYGAIQSTRPQTLSYGLTDSPAGLAAWVLEKWRGWADSGGDIDAAFSRDFLLTVVTLYWVTQTIESSMRDYVDNRWLAAELGPADAVTVPTAVAVFANQFIDDGTPPREWAERLYNIRRWTPMPSGGHFPSAEQPGLLSRDIAAFFNDPGALARLRQGEPGLQPQVLAVPGGGPVEGFGLGGGQVPVGPQVELHAVAADDAPHGGQELRVDQGHPGRGLPGARHEAGGVEEPARVLVAAVGLVEDLEQVAAGLLESAGRFAGSVPEGAPVVLERVEPVVHLLQAGPHVGEGERCPVGEVALGRRAVPGEIAQRELGQGLGPPEPAGRRHAFVDERVGVLAVGDPPAADQPAQLGVGQQQHQQLPAAPDANLAQLVSQLRAGEVAPARQDLQDRGDGLVNRALVEAVRVA